MSQNFELEIYPTNQQLNQNLENLAGNEYPGRLLAVGLAQSGKIALQAYALTGRSEGSRDRVFINDGNGIKTAAPGKTTEEMAEVPDADLIYYRAMQDRGGMHVVSNGAQTEPVLWNMLGAYRLLDSIQMSPPVRGIQLNQYEPDAPNYTPRIVGVLEVHPDAYEISLGHAYAMHEMQEVSFSGGEGDTAIEILTPVTRSYDTFRESGDLPIGIGFALQTYAGNGKPLPSYTEAPYAIPFLEDAESTADMLWGVLNKDNRVAVVVKEISLESGETEGYHIINKHDEPEVD